MTPAVHHPEPLVWLSPCFGLPDWIELYTILSFDADMPVPLHLSSGNYALPMATGQATHRVVAATFCPPRASKTDNRLRRRSARGTTKLCSANGR